ncbi:MAG: hypothetical protein KDD25_09675, partial [Bdellovibrionales bacterium]|nr:hypothetical protein [Bdellovibrionales bacterium]
KLSKEFPVEFYFTDCQGNEFQGVQSRYLDTQFGHQYLLSNGLNNSACLYLGIEEFSIIEEARSDQPWKTEIGPIGVESKRFIELPIQPTSKLSTSRLGMGTLCSPASGYEPGPVVFGRSLYPMTIDVIQHVCGDVLPDPVKSLSKPSMERKIDEGVASFFQHEFNDRKEQVQFLFEEIISQISFALLKHPSSKFTVKGAFGRALCPAIQERLNGAKTIIEVSDGIL